MLRYSIRHKNFVTSGTRHNNKLQSKIMHLIVAGYLWDLMYSGTCLMWSPMGPHVQWNLSNVVTHGTSCTVEPV